MIVLGVPASLVYRESSLLHKSLVQGQGSTLLGVIYLALLGWSLAMYFITCFTDPGYIDLATYRPPARKTIKPSINSDEEEEEEREGEEETGQMIPGEDGPKYRVCDYCEITQPMRAKHCEDCNKCVHKFDHHCPWLETCIGEQNHRYFWLFLLSTQTLIMVTVYLTWNAFSYHIMWQAWWEVNGVLVFDLMILFIGGLVVGGLLAFHSYLMVQGLTTWEAASRERITYLKYLGGDYNPFNEGMFKNLREFLCVWHPRRWEAVYACKAKGAEGIV